MKVKVIKTVKNAQSSSVVGKLIVLASFCYADMVARGGSIMVRPKHNVITDKNFWVCGTVSGPASLNMDWTAPKETWEFLLLEDGKLLLHVDGMVPLL